MKFIPSHLKENLKDPFFSVKKSMKLKSTVHFKSKGWLCTMSPQLDITKTNLTLSTLCVLLCRETQQSWDPNACIQGLQRVKKYVYIQVQRLKTQVWYWETWTWDGKRPWTSALPASPTPASMRIFNLKLENMTWERYLRKGLWILMIGWRGKITTSKSPIPDQDGVLGFSSAVNTYLGMM